MLCLQPFRIFNTWVGDPAKMALLAAVLDVIKVDRLLDNARDVGQYMLSGLVNLQVRCGMWGLYCLLDVYACIDISLSLVSCQFCLPQKIYKKVVLYCIVSCGYIFFC